MFDSVLSQPLAWMVLCSGNQRETKIVPIDIVGCFLIEGIIDSGAGLGLSPPGVLHPMADLTSI